MKILIPGSFDPPTNGHIDVITRCLKVFDEVLVGVIVNPSKESLFSTEVRYSGASLGYQLGAIVGGSFAPIIATLLWKNYDIFWVSVYIAFASILSLISVYMLTETFQKDLSD